MNDDHDEFCSVYKDDQLCCLIITLSTKKLRLVEKILWGIGYDQLLWYFRVVVCESCGAARKLDPVLATPWHPRQSCPTSPFRLALAAFLRQFAQNRRIDRDFSHPLCMASYRVAMHINELPTVSATSRSLWGTLRTRASQTTESESERLITAVAPSLEESRREWSLPQSIMSPRVISCDHTRTPRVTCK